MNLFIILAGGINPHFGENILTLAKSIGVPIAMVLSVFVVIQSILSGKNILKNLISTLIFCAVCIAVVNKPEILLDLGNFMIEFATDVVVENGGNN